MRISPEDKQSLIQIKNTLSQNKKWLLGIIIGIILPIVSYQIYQYNQQQNSLKNSDIFLDYVDAINAQDYNKIIADSPLIETSGFNSAYAKQKLFLLANAQYESGNADEASAILEKIIEEAGDGSIYYHLANIQLIRLEIDKGDFLNAESRVNQPSQTKADYELIYSYYQALIHRALGRNDRAKAGFTKVLEMAQNDRQFTELVNAQMALIP